MPEPPEGWKMEHKIDRQISSVTVTLELYRSDVVNVSIKLRLPGHLCFTMWKMKEQDEK